MADAMMQLAAVLIALSILSSIFRLVRGPTPIDRVVALDVLTIITIGLIALYAHIAGRGLYLDVALVYGLLSFLSVLAVARFFERGL